MSENEAVTTIGDTNPFRVPSDRKPCRHEADPILCAACSVDNTIGRLSDRVDELEALRRGDTFAHGIHRAIKIIQRHKRPGSAERLCAALIAKLRAARPRIAKPR